MKPFPRVMLLVLGFGILAAVLSLVPTRPVAAKDSATVTVANTPLPTTVTNTPSVTISGTPTVSFSNTSSTPLFVQDVDNPALQPFAQECGTSDFDAAGRASCSFGAVPPGKRFVIETVSGQLQIASGTKPISINLQVCAAGNATDNFFPAALQGNSAFFTGDFFTVNQRVRLYADNTGGCSGALFFNIVISNTTSGSADLVVSGYLVNVP